MPWLPHPLDGYAAACADWLVARFIVVRQKADKLIFYAGAETFTGNAARRYDLGAGRTRR